MPRYSSSGKNLSAMVHAKQAHKCTVCGRVVYGNGGWSSHKRAHLRAEGIQSWDELLHKHGVITDEELYERVLRALDR
jgi:hypothetical protein